MLSRLDARLRRLEARTADTAWLRGHGFASLIEHARRMPPDAFELDERLDAATPPKGMARLLWEIWHGHDKEPSA